MNLVISYLVCIFFQVLGSLSYLVSQSSTGVLASSRSALASASLPSNKERPALSNTREQESSLNKALISTSTNHSPDVLSILSPFERCSNIDASSLNRTPTALVSDKTVHLTSLVSSSSIGTSNSVQSAPPFGSSSGQHQVSRARNTDQLLLKEKLDEYLLTGQSTCVMRVYGSRLLNNLSTYTLSKQTTPHLISQIINGMLYYFSNH